MLRPRLKQLWGRSSLVQRPLQRAPSACQAVASAAPATHAVEALRQAPSLCFIGVAASLGGAAAGAALVALAAPRLAALDVAAESLAESAAASGAALHELEEAGPVRVRRRASGGRADTVGWFGRRSDAPTDGPTVGGAAGLLAWSGRTRSGNRMRRQCALPLAQLVPVVPTPCLIVVVRGSLCPQLD